jgi:hypothetical protein
MAEHRQARKIATIRPDRSFSCLLALPYELRRQVWIEYLQESTPLVYRFSIRYNLHSRVRYTEGAFYETYHYAPQPNDTVVLAAPAYHYYGSIQWQNLVHSTSASRATLATCQESRQIALKFLPHSLPFRRLPVCWTVPQAKAKLEEPADGSNYPEYILHFNGARDIIVFQDATWEDQEAVVKISQLQGRVPDAFMWMEHVGISMRSFACGHRSDPGGEPGSYGVTRSECACSTDACRDACQYEPLPRFLSCFPSLKAFYIARVSRDYEDGGDELTGRSISLENADCHCGANLNEEITVEPQHSWSVIKSSDINRWCVVWDERTGCIPVHSRIGLLRQYWRPNFPYYKEMKHLDIKFIRRLDPGDIRDDKKVDMVVDNVVAAKTRKEMLKYRLLSILRATKHLLNC